MAFSEKFEDVMMVVAEKVGDNVYLSAIKDAFTAFMPFVIVGSMGTLLKTLVSSTTTGLAQWVPALAGLREPLGHRQLDDAVPGGPRRPFPITHPRGPPGSCARRRACSGRS